MHPVEELARREIELRRGPAIRLGGLAALLGGAAWTIKGGAILLSGNQPPYLFEAAPTLFALGQLGLAALLPEGAGRLRRIGIALAALSGLAGVLAVFMLESASDESSFSPWVFASFLSNLAALIVLGIAVRRSAVSASPLRWLPLGLGIMTFPLVAVGGALEQINDRLLEVPLVLLGLAWIRLGCLIAFARSAAFQAVPSSPSEGLG